MLPDKLRGTWSFDIKGGPKILGGGGAMNPNDAMMGFNCLKAREPLRGGSLLFTTKSPGVPGTHLFNLGSMTG